LKNPTKKNEKSSNVTDARSKRTSPMYHVQGVIISRGDAAKIRKDFDNPTPAEEIIIFYLC